HADQALLDACAEEHAAELDRASLIPWQARWPALRDAYLRWLRQHEQDGGRFLRAELAMHYTLTDELTLQGRMDRLDEQHGTPILIDYKTERRSRTDARIKERYEEVQLPFYALLAQGKMTDESGGTIPHADQAQAVYLSLDDREDTAKACALEDLGELKNLLAQGILHDASRLKEGFPAYPLGQSPHCDYCDVKGLCRKAYWTEPLDESQGKEDKKNKEEGL
ncbi:MAG: RecB family exonuclease, partial [Saezia sp.]